MIYTVKYNLVKEDDDSLTKLSKISWTNDVVFLLNSEDLKHSDKIVKNLRAKYHIRRPITSTVVVGCELVTKEDIWNIHSTI